MPFLLALGNLIKYVFVFAWLVYEGSTETNVSAQWSMKGAVSCDKQCDVQPPVNHGRPGMLDACQGTSVSPFPQAHYLVCVYLRCRQSLLCFAALSVVRC